MLRWHQWMENELNDIFPGWILNLDLIFFCLRNWMAVILNEFGNRVVFVWEYLVWFIDCGRTLILVRQSIMSVDDCSHNSQPSFPFTTMSLTLRSNFEMNRMIQRKAKFCFESINNKAFILLKERLCSKNKTSRIMISLERKQHSHPVDGEPMSVIVTECQWNSYWLCSYARLVRQLRRGNRAGAVDSQMEN